MVDVRMPEEDRLPPDQAVHRSQLLHDYGALIAAWAEFELGVEIKIAALAGMEPKRASIVLCSLPFGTKANILYSLLDLDGQGGVIKAVKGVVEAARRNALIHSTPTADDTHSRFAFVRREVRESYKVATMEFNADEFHAHFLEFRRKVQAGLTALGYVTNDFADDYARKAGFYWPNP